MKAKAAKQRTRKFKRPEPAQGPGKSDPSGQIPDFGAARNQEGADERSESGDGDTVNLESAPLRGAGERREFSDTTSYTTTARSHRRN